MEKRIRSNTGTKSSESERWWNELNSVPLSPDGFHTRGCYLVHHTRIIFLWSESSPSDHLVIRMRKMMRICKKKYSPDEFHTLYGLVMVSHVIWFITRGSSSHLNWLWSETVWSLDDKVQCNHNTYQIHHISKKGGGWGWTSGKKGRCGGYKSIGCIGLTGEG